MNPPEFARHWALELGSNPDTLVQLQGGINNQVFRCGSPGRHWVIKAYPSKQLDQRDRMQAEVDFLRYSTNVAPGFTPQLIHVDHQYRCVVLEHIDGKKYVESDILNHSDLQAAVNFFRKLNSEPKVAKDAIRMDAAEGFHSLREHMTNVHKRLAAMEIDHLHSEYKPLAAELLHQLNDCAKEVNAYLEAQITAGDVEDSLDSEYLCVSPSDFGFHNAILTSSGVRFIDFEFAGWDDPTKLIIDFRLQPRIPVLMTIESLAYKFLKKKSKFFEARLSTLAHILRLKWACIILSILQPNRLKEIHGICSGNNLFQIIELRLANARSYLITLNNLR